MTNNESRRVGVFRSPETNSDLDEHSTTPVRAAKMALRSTLVTCLLALLAVSAAAEGEFARAEFRSCGG